VAITNAAGQASRLTSNAFLTVVLGPSNQTAVTGGQATFGVTAVGNAPAFYQWRFNDVNLTNATNNTLTVTNVQSADVGRYSVVVTVVTNRPIAPAIFSAFLFSDGPPAILAQPQNVSAVVGATASFGVTAGGTAPLSYQWRFNGADISGATNASLTLTNLRAADAGAYSVIVSNASGSLTSTDAQLTVQPGLNFIGGSAFLAGGQFQVQLDGVPGQGFVMEASSDLLNWIPVYTNGGGAGTIQFIDPAAGTFPRRFYRGRAVP